MQNMGPPQQVMTQQMPIATNGMMMVGMPGNMQMTGPRDQFMGDPMGNEDWGKTIAKGMTDPRNFRIVHVPDRAGCCYYNKYFACCNKELRKRDYFVVGENFIESNNPIPACCCWCLVDNISKKYYDRKPFAPSCVETFCTSWCAGEFVTENDTSYCCCINCVCMYNCFSKPCNGGFVARSSIHKQSCLWCLTKLCPTSCCLPAIVGNVKDSEKTAQIMTEQLKNFRNRAGSQMDLAGEFLGLS